MDEATSSTPAGADPPQIAGGRSGNRDTLSALVVTVALVALVGIVAIVVLKLPAAQKGQNIIAIATASFGVIGAIVGAYFGVSSSNRAAEIVRSTRAPSGRRGSSTGS